MTPVYSASVSGLFCQAATSYSRKMPPKIAVRENVSISILGILSKTSEKGCSNMRRKISRLQTTLKIKWAIILSFGLSLSPSNLTMIGVFMATKGPHLQEWTMPDWLFVYGVLYLIWEYSSFPISPGGLTTIAALIATISDKGLLLQEWTVSDRLSALGVLCLIYELIIAAKYAGLYQQALEQIKDLNRVLTTNQEEFERKISFLNDEHEHALAEEKKSSARALAEIHDLLAEKEREISDLKATIRELTAKKNVKSHDARKDTVTGRDETHIPNRASRMR